MKDKIIEGLGGYKEYEIEMASSVIGLSISQMLLSKRKCNVDDDIESIMELLVSYDLSDHYEDSTCWSSSYYFYKYHNLPTTLDIIKNGTKEGFLDREKWMPVLELFFAKTKEFLAEIPEGYDDYLQEYVKTQKED